MSPTRKRYVWRLVGRILILLCCIILWVISPNSFLVLEKMNFFQHFSVFHILWAIWVIDMIQQIIPVKNRLSLGSQKLFANRFRPANHEINREEMKDYIVAMAQAASKVLVLWCALIAIIGILYFNNVLGKNELFLLSVVFYVCDLICVLIWCPFRLLMGNRCCTTCRIFNWDHLMMFSPMIFMGGFYAGSLVGMAFLAWLVWELSVVMHPERFWEKSNLALRCSECTDKLCVQYCQKRYK